jgi:predicted dinucleotide-binding enzyme
MPFSSLFRKSAPSPTNAAIIELIYAGNDMAAHLVMKDGRDFSCVCGMIVGPVENPSHHRNFCPVARFYAAVEAARLPQKAGLPW